MTDHDQDSPKLRTRERVAKTARDFASLGMTGLAASLFVGAIACSRLLGDVDVERAALTPGERGVGLAGTCELGAVQCAGAALQLCSPDGSRWITNSVCGSPALCKTDPPECLPPECALDQLSCEGAVLRVCNASRDGWVELDSCPSAAHCSPNSRQCLAAPCVAGELACNQEELQRCADDELGWVPLESCETQGLCELARSAGESSCSPPACEAGAQRCVGADLQHCNEGRTEFGLVETCTNASLCELSVANGSAVCESPSCLPGEHLCRAETLTVCNEERTGFDDETACESAALCDPASGSCQPAACDPGARRCNGAQIEICSADRSAFQPASDAPCASARLCVQSPAGGVSCRAPVCSEGQFECTPGGLLRRCSAGLDAWEDVRLCATPALCDAALGPQGCRTPVCANDERRCDGTSVVECRTGRDGFDTVAECGDAGCNATTDVCRDPCVIGRARCTGSALEECTDPLVGWELIDTCSAREVCNAATATCQAAACNADQLRCQGARLEVCNQARTGFSLLETCGSEALCVEVGNSNRFRCDAPACGAGEAECRNNGDLAVCNADRTAFDVTNCGLLGCNDAERQPRCRTLGDLLGGGSN